jgi:hypothetical protein
MLRWISGTWCKTMHRQAMWPIHGRYLCPQCLYVHTVDWEQPYNSVPVGARQPQGSSGVSIVSTAAVTH